MSPWPRGELSLRHDRAELVLGWISLKRCSRTHIFAPSPLRARGRADGWLAAFACRHAPQPAKLSMALVMPAQAHTFAYLSISSEAASRRPARALTSPPRSERPSRHPACGFALMFFVVRFVCVIVLECKRNVKDNKQQ